MKRGIFVAVLVLLLGPSLGIAYAQHSSTNYKIEESVIGPGGQLDSSSASYEARATVGDLGVGFSESSTYGIYAGSTTTAAEYIEFSVNTSSIDVGVLSTTAPTTASATFSVKSYLASGYVVTTESAPPTYGTDQLNGLASPTASSPGTEQFGINVVANTLPEAVGANPVQTPDATFSFGGAATDYDTANVYKYVEGDVIAESTTSSGQTDYTISYLFNISGITPGGEYIMNHVLVATATY